VQIGMGDAVEIAEGEDAKHDFALDAALLHGQVVDQTGAPVPGAMVMLNEPNQQVSALHADAQGSFEMDLQGSGDFTVRASHPGYKAGSGTHFQVSDENSSLAPVTLVLTKESTLRGALVLADGSPAAGVLVASVAQGVNTTANSATSDAAGSFEV